MKKKKKVTRSKTLKKVTNNSTNTNSSIKYCNFFDSFNIPIDKIYPTLVVSTMSSGKSTLINSLIGKSILPSSNQACTARTLAILDNDSMDGFDAHIVDNNGQYSKILNVSSDATNEFNKYGNISEMIIEGEIKGVKNSIKAMLLIDSPGVNNSMDVTHGDITRKALEQFDEGLIIYIINVTQIGTDDDNYFLKYVSDRIKKSNDFNIIFVANKMDVINPKNESIDELMNNCIRYIENQGIKNPTIVPVSARCALIVKKILAGIKLTEMEEEDFYRDYRHFKRGGLSLQDYIVDGERSKLYEKIEIDDKKYSKAELYALLENTGIPYLEKKIDELLVKSQKLETPKIKLKRRNNNG